MRTPVTRASESDDRSIKWRAATCSPAGPAGTDSGAETIVQAYYDHIYRRVPMQYRGELDTFDFDAQHQRALGRAILVVGGGYRQYRGDDLGDGPGFFFDPQDRVSHRSNVFAQAQFSLSPQFFLTGGIQGRTQRIHGRRSCSPAVRCAGLGRRKPLWGSVSKAVRVPTRFDTDLRFRVPNTNLIALSRH